MESASISPMASFLPDLFPEIWDDSKGMLALNKVISVAPILDAYKENMVYITKCKLKPRDPNGWILAIDTREEKLVALAPFSNKRAYFDHYYFECDFSRYINKAPGEGTV